jgi:hypothetical protein
MGRPAVTLASVAPIAPVEALLLAVLKGQREIALEQARQDTKLDAILQAVERRDRSRRPAPLSREGLGILRRILPAVVGVRGSEGAERLTSRDLVEDEAPAIRLAVGQLTAKQIGKLFARAEGIPIDGLMVQRDGVDFHVTAWRIVAC